ncbi:transcriptional regulator [Bacteroidia bacterium]|nr:transcriptional regulator [Bacteroidia bacterium]
MEVSDKLDFWLLGQGNTVKEAMDDFYASRDDMKSLYSEQGKYFPEDLQFEVKYDTQSFLQFYATYFSLAGLSRLTGIHQGQLSHYVTGKRNPSRQTIEKIDKSIHGFAQNLSQVQFV